MQLTTQTDYALRTLMYLASMDGRATASKIAALFGISQHHVAKVLSLLTRLGYVRSIRGIGGGIELARRPEDIRIGDVIEAFEGKFRMLNCIDVPDVCAIQTFCKLRGLLAEADQRTRDFLNGSTLADVAPRRKRLLEAAVN